MTQTLKATFDGKVFQPIGPVEIPPNTSVELTVYTPEKKKIGKPYSFFRYAASLKLKGPKDFSANLDEYLYHGKPME